MLFGLNPLLRRRSIHIRQVDSDLQHIILSSEEGIQDVGIEMGTATSPHQLGTLVERIGFLIRAMTVQGVEHVGNRRDATFEWYLFTAEAEWIAAAIPTLVVGLRDCGGYGNEPSCGISGLN